MKIAILGTAPCRKDAPFDDPSWSLWGTGRAIRPGKVYTAAGLQDVGRYDAWIQTHSREHILKDTTRYRALSLAHVAWLDDQDKPILTLGDFHSRMATRLPVEDLVAEYGDYFMTSSIAWGLAHAIYMGATEIGLWGVQQKAADEYVQQRPGVMHFLYLAKSIGIRVHLPEGSLLSGPFEVYPHKILGAGGLVSTVG